MFKELMSETKFLSDYSRYNEELGRYETFDEAVDRVMAMHKEFYKDKQSKELTKLFDGVSTAYKNKLFLGAQRALQFGGEQLLKHHARLYNCASTYCDRIDVFAESMYMLLCGAGVGFSVQKQHIAKLPKLVEKDMSVLPAKFTIEDSIEGWSDAIKYLMLSYTEGNEYSGKTILFDYSQIRPKGSFISGGFKAPGAEPLRLCINTITNLLDSELNKGIEHFRTIVAYDIMMYIADAVISGGVRRSATICMFSKDDEDMIKAKTGDWYLTNPQRGRSNNSVMLLRDSTTFEEFQEIMKSVQHSGEPGFIWVDDLEFTLNPCVEVGMYPRLPDGRTGFQVCNLTEINGSKSDTEEIFYEQCKWAAVMCTLQAGYTDFKYLSSISKEIVDKEALIGVGITGFMNNPKILFNPEILSKGAEIVKKWNRITATLIEINPAARATVVKPSGNASVLLGTSSGIHGDHSTRYIRHMQMSKDSEMAKFFQKEFPEMCQDSVWNRERDIVIAYPIEPKEGSIFKKDLLGVKQLEYVRLVQQSWITSGKTKELCSHSKLSHNVSNTITVDSWEEVTDYIYNNRYDLCGVSLLAASGDKAYPQAPFTEVLTEEEIIAKYGRVALFTSALIEVGLNAFNNDLWLACNTVLGYGEVLSDNHEHLLKRDFVRRVEKFSKHFSSVEECTNCLKDVYNLHKWWKITSKPNSIKELAYGLTKPKYVDIDTMGAQACAGGKCEL